MYRGRSGGTPGAQRAATPPAPPPPERVVDPRDLRFPEGLSPDQRVKLEEAMNLHLEALDLFAARNGAGGAERAAAALRRYEEAGALVPGLSQLHHDRVVQLYQSGDARRAVQEANQWLARFPDSADHLETLGIAEYRMGDFKSSAHHFGRAAALRPDSLILQRRLAEVHTQLGTKEQALAAAERALELIGFRAPAGPSHPEADATLQMALRTFHRFYDYARLLPVAEAVLRRSPGDAPATIAAGVSHRELGHYPEAVKLLSSVVNDPENGEEVRFELGIATFKGGDPRKAAEVFQALLEKNPQQSRAYYQYSLCLHRLKRPDLAEAMGRAARSLAQSDRELRREVEQRAIGRPAEARRARAKALALRGQFREAEAVLRDPEVKGHPGAAIYLADLLCESWRAREAEDALTEAARLLGPNHADVLGWRARVLAISGRPGEAVPILEPLTRRSFPGNPWPQTLGRVYLEDLEDPQGAIPWLKLALSDPPQAGELALLGRAQLLAGHPEEARQLLEPVSRGEPEWEPQIRVPLALALVRSVPPAADAALDLLRGAGEESHSDPLYSNLVVEAFSRSTVPAEADRAHALRRAEGRRAELRKELHSLRTQIALAPWPSPASLLLRASEVQDLLGNRGESVRLARLAASASPGDPSILRALSQRLDDLSEVFLRLSVLREWREKAPQDGDVARLEAEAKKLLVIP